MTLPSPRNVRRILATVAVATAVAASLAVSSRIIDTTAAVPRGAFVLSGSMQSGDASCETSLPAGAQCPVSIALGGNLSTGASNVVPGDTIARTVTITNDGRVDLSSITLRVDPDRDETSLMLRVEKCDQAWTVESALVYSCPNNRKSSVLSRDAIAIEGASLGNLRSLKRGGVDHLLFTIDMPDGASLEIENGSVTDVLYEFTAVQATSRGKGPR